jgi:hypothetical protein
MVIQYITAMSYRRRVLVRSFVSIGLFQRFQLRKKCFPRRLCWPLHVRVHTRMQVYMYYMHVMNAFG